MTPLPRLELADRRSPFDEAVITIGGREEDTITIELQKGNPLHLADQLIRYVNAQQDVIQALQAAAELLSVHGNPAHARRCAELSKVIGEAA